MQEEGASDVGDGERVDVVVDRVDRTDLNLALRGLPRYTLTAASAGGDKVDITSVAQARALLSSCSEEKPITLWFRQPDPVMPPRGFARKKLRKATGQGMTEQQKEWCEAYVSAVEAKSSEPRAPTVHAAMKSEFGLTGLDEEVTFCCE